MPDWVPDPDLTVFATGFCEIAGAIGLHVPALRRAAGIGLALYAITVFPANIKHAILDMSSSTPVLGLSYHLPRLALQPFLVWAAWVVSRP
jgi:uncharacterized membrane protein